MDPSIQPLQARTQPQRKSINQVDTDKTLEQAGLVVSQGNPKRARRFELKMLIKKPDDIKASEITDKQVYLDRRLF
ncbi:MAG TPA: hypothetical protein VES69_05390, partial [Pyrinomonadaceae bacterium]|nr:hypothetical protein [Pyrinomonadaceae bacterium]